MENINLLYGIFGFILGILFSAATIVKLLYFLKRRFIPTLVKFIDESIKVILSDPNWKASKQWTYLGRAIIEVAITNKGISYKFFP